MTKPALDGHDTAMPSASTASRTERAGLVRTNSSPREPELRKSTSTVRFSEDTAPGGLTGRSGWPATSASMEEITPITQAEEYSRRNYNTSDTQASLPSSSTAQRNVKAPAPVDTDVPSNVDGNERGRSWYKKIAEKYGSVTLDNKGSVARDHLALERTFLAWLRTSLAFASIGIAITQLFRLNTSLANRARSLTYVTYPTAGELPFSPLIGHSIPVELLPYIYQIAASTSRSAVTPELGPTLLDQLLLLPPSGQAQLEDRFESWDEFHETASAGKIRHLGKPLGATFIGISIIVLLVGFHRYFESQYWIMRGKFPASRGSIVLVSFIAGALIVASLVVILVVNPTQYEKK